MTTNNIKLSNIALITARGGSKGIPRKNIARLCGQPLIAWTIKAAQQSNAIDLIYVSTDDPEIAQISYFLGAKVINRPKELAKDNSGSEPVIEHAINYLKKKKISLGLICLLQPTSPLRTYKDINKAFTIYKTTHAKCVLSVFQPNLCISKAYQIEKDGSINGLFGYNAPYTRRQDLPQTVMPNGAIYLFSAIDFLSEKRIPRENVFPYLMPEDKSVDIDLPRDLIQAEKLLKKRATMNNPSFTISNRKVGNDYPPLVIAEIGINHEGSLSTAKQMVDAAIAAGAEIIKHQTHVIDDEMCGEAKKVIPGNADVSIYDIMQRCALNEQDELQLKEYIESKGAIFLSTPFSRAAAQRLQRMNVQAYKIGSGECNNYPLLELIASYGKPVILSTGMNDINSIQKSVDILRKHKVPYALLHCTNVYPTPDNLIRLGCIQELQNAFPDAVIGLSDHSIDNLACLSAAALGASILERHFTDSKDRSGPDINCSMDQQECAELITQSRRVKVMSGGKKAAVPEEQATINFAYASVVTIKAIKKGDKFTSDNLWVKRPGTGDFLAENYNQLINKTASMDIDNDTLLKKEHVYGN